MHIFIVHFYRFNKNNHDSSYTKKLDIYTNIVLPMVLGTMADLTFWELNIL